MVNIILPYENAEIYGEIWADSENEVYFEKDSFAAARCTVSFAAAEIKRYLNKISVESKICSKANNTGEFCITLEICDDNCTKDDYSLIPCENGICISGKGRSGVLYGAYEFLKLQGFAWYVPGDIGEVVPAAKEKPNIPTERTDFAPHMYEGRGFDFENHSIESAQLWLWMARNRLNFGVYSYKHNALQKKLCIKFKTGGHIFEKLLAPDRVTKSGKTIWEEHRDWYGKRRDGKEVTKKNCLSTQFCVSNDELIEFLSDEIVKKMNGEWSYADRADIWGFDTWGSVCDCEKCRRIGNATDITLHFISALRTALDESGIGRRVRLVTCAYDGTGTMEPPKNPIPKNLIKASDMVVFYPITRCYEHDIYDENCPVNRRFAELLRGWLAVTPSLPMVIGEYYNVSKFEDLPIIFTQRIRNEIPYYRKMGVLGITYMHFPLLNMGMRSITHLLYAELSWNINADCDKLINEYFKEYYGEYAEDMKQVYDLTEKAFSRCTQWRAWGEGSVLSQLLAWDGGIPEKPIKTDGHFTDHKSIIESGEKSAELLKEALEITKKTEKKEIMQRGSIAVRGGAVNPIELEKMNLGMKISRRISEAKRFLIYGEETMRIMTETVRLYDMLMSGEKDVEKCIAELSRLHDSLDSRYIPIASNALVNEMMCKSALERTQLKGIAEKCMAVYGGSV